MRPVPSLSPSLPRYQDADAYTPLERASYRLSLGSQLAARFSIGADAVHDLEALVTSDLLRVTYSPENAYWSSDFVNYETGEMFSGHGILQNFASSRLSPAYLSAASRRQRRRILKSIQNTKVLVGFRYRFWTLTLPFIPAPFGTVLAVKDRAFALFRKRALWVDNVQGAHTGEESTVGAETTYFRTHHHVHIHGLVLSRYIDEKNVHLISTEWTDCVEKACREYGVPCRLPRNTNRLIVDVRDVGAYANKKQIAFEDAIQELCKYTVKGSDFLKLRPSELVEVERALFNRQMIRSYGCFNKRSGRAQNREEKSKTARNTPSLDTRCIVDGKRDEARTLKQTGITLCEQGRRAEWLALLDLIAAGRIAERRIYLAQKYPHATFYALDGSEWRGVSETTRHRKGADVIDLTRYRLQEQRKPLKTHL